MLQDSMMSVTGSSLTSGDATLGVPREIPQLREGPTPFARFVFRRPLRRDLGHAWHT